MRDIKFRQYVPLSRGFHYWGRISPDAFVGPITDKQYATDSMQYTGLKDRNGKEIYEGDIVKNKNIELSQEVIFKYGRFWAGVFCLQEAVFNLDFVVIGNIHEGEGRK